MRRKILLGIVILVVCIVLGYVLGTTLLVLALIAFGLGFLIGRRRRAH
jgi:hypothetical protein